LQSVQDESVTFGLQTAAHDDPSSPASWAPEVAPPSPMLPDDPELVAPLPPPELAPLAPPELVAPLEVPEPVAPLEVPEPVAPLAPPELVAPLAVPEPLGPLPLFPHAVSPTVEDAPATTRAWKSFSIFMMQTARFRGFWGKARRRHGRY
jgi:hypothetical protein